MGWNILSLTNVFAFKGVWNSSRHQSVCEAAYKGSWWLARNLIRLAICSTGNFPVLERTSLRDFEALKMITHKRKEGSSQAYHVI
jgi:hypothetical protein